MKRLLLALLFPLALLGQSITTQPTSQTVVAGQTATFTMTVAGGPCRSVVLVTGTGAKNVYGPYDTTLLYSVFNTTLAQSGWTIQFQLYGCSSGAAQLLSDKVTLTVTPPPTPVSLSIPTANSILGIGQTVTMKATGTYADGSTKDLTAAAVWTSDTPGVASVAAGAVLGVTAGQANVTATMGSISASTALTVKPVLTIIFTPTFEDGSVPAAVLAVSQVVTNPDGTTTVTPALQLPDLGGATVGKLLYDSTLLYQAAFLLDGTVVGQPLVFSPTLFKAIMPNITQETFSVVLYNGVPNGASGSIKSMAWSVQ